MRSLFHFKNKPLIGLDINADEIRLVQLQWAKSGIFIAKHAIASVPAGVISEGKIHTATIMIDLLTNLISQTGIGGSPVAVALPASHVLSKQIKVMENLSSEEFEREIFNNLERYFPGVPENLCCDYVMKSPHEAMLWVVKLEQLKTYLAVLATVGLRAQIVDIDTFALVRSLTHLYPTAEVCAVLDVNSVAAQFIVIAADKIIFSQLLSIAGLQNEFKQVLQLYHSMHAQTVLSSIVLVGNSDLFIELRHFLQQECNLQSKAMPQVQYGKKGQQVEMTANLFVAYGLALRASHI